MPQKHQRKNFPIDVPHKIAIDLSFSEEQFQKIIFGLSAKEMENRWRIYYENDTLFFQRSWTGYTIFEAKIHKEKNRYFIFSTLIIKALQRCEAFLWTLSGDIG